MKLSLNNLTLDHLYRALALPDFDAAAAWLKMAPQPRPLERSVEKPGSAKTAGVLLIVYPDRDHLTFTLTRRTDNVASHKGQISLPGGAQEQGETTRQTALRETCEEIGLCLEDSNLIGVLTPIYVSVSDFEIHPFVARLDSHPQFNPDPIEVAEVLEAPLLSLLDDGLKERERWNLRGAEMDVPFYRINGQIVWGATAAILSELEWRLRHVFQADTQR